jgi:tetratricopeptide (TPR) repeat protein
VKGDKEATNKYINQALAITDLTKETKIAILMSGGQSFVRIGEFNEALNFYNQALKINPKEPSVLESLGSLYLAQSKYDLALQYLNEALDISTDDKKRVDLFFNRGLVYLKMKNFDEAEYNFEEAYFLAPEDLEALLGLAQALEEAERWRKARNYYMELIDQNPNDPQYYYGVYRTYFGEGRLEDAQEYLNKATALKSN